jgi:hypothetical protein
MMPTGKSFGAANEETRSGVYRYLHGSLQNSNRNNCTHECIQADADKCKREKTNEILNKVDPKFIFPKLAPGLNSYGINHKVAVALLLLLLL